MPQFQYGDPYGNRTRASAVEEHNATKTTACPAFPVTFLSLDNNGLRGRGDAFGASPGPKCKAPDLAATGSSASTSYLPQGEAVDTTTGRVRIVGTLHPRWGVGS